MTTQRGVKEITKRNKNNSVIKKLKIGLVDPVCLSTSDLLWRLFDNTVYLWATIYVAEEFDSYFV